MERLGHHLLERRLHLGLQQKEAAKVLGDWGGTTAGWPATLAFVNAASAD
jgi:hypothetical protein